MQTSTNIAEQLKEELGYSFGKVIDIEVIDLNENPELDDEEHFAIAFAAVSIRKEGHPVDPRGSPTLELWSVSRVANGSENDPRNSDG